MSSWICQRPRSDIAWSRSLGQQAQLRVSQHSLWVVLRQKTGLRLKRSWSTHKSERASRTNGSVKPLRQSLPQAEGRRWVVVDGTWFNTQMSRAWRWAEKGECVREAISAGHRHSFTLLGSLTASRLLVPMTIAGGASLLYLPPYSPDLNSIEKCWSKIKQTLLSLKSRAVEALEVAMTVAPPRSHPRALGLGSSAADTPKSILI